MVFTPDQIEKLKTLGIDFKYQPKFTVVPLVTQTKIRKSPVIPLISISGLTLLSFSGLILFKTKNTANIASLPTHSPVRSPKDVGGPTQASQSIQQYLLSSQQYFTQALTQQQASSPPNNQTIATYLNQSILAATDAIKQFPSDSRGYLQRGKIYQSLVNSQPQFLNQAIIDLSTAQKLDPQSAEITRSLAGLYAKKGDAQNTIIYLGRTISLDPTVAQNFYDLAKIQQQVGLLPEALNTYNRLLTLLTDISQKSAVESEVIALEKLVAQNPQGSSIKPTPTSAPLVPDGVNPIQAMLLPTETPSSLIIAAPETSKNLAVTNQTDSNSLSGESILPAGQASLTINNQNLSASSQVYVTITKGGKNQVLKVLSKSADSFVVGFDSPLSEDVEFRYWIINP